MATPTSNIEVISQTHAFYSQIFSWKNHSNKLPTPLMQLTVRSKAPRQ